MHVIIVGAGITGLSTAWALVKRGVEVTLIEQGPIPNPLSASGDQHRIIRRAYGGQGGYQRRISDAYAVWDEMWDDLGARHLVDTGFMVISQEEGDEGEDYWRGMVEAGYSLDQMSPAEACARYPFLSPEGLRFVAVHPEGGVLLCQKIAADMRAFLLAKGARLLENTKVVAVDRAAGRVTLESGEDLTADRVVISAGAWVLKLAPELGSDLTPYRTAVVYLEPPADLKASWEAAPVILDVGGKVDGYVLPPVPGTGLKFGAGIHKVKNADADQNRGIVPGEGERLRNHFSPPFGRISEYQVSDVVTCAYTFTADNHFYAREDGRAVIVSACSGHGYKFGAVVGQKIAEGLIGGDVDTARIWLEARD